MAVTFTSTSSVQDLTQQLWEGLENFEKYAQCSLLDMLKDDVDKATDPASSPAEPGSPALYQELVPSTQAPSYSPTSAHPLPLQQGYYPRYGYASENLKFPGVEQGVGSPNMASTSYLPPALQHGKPVPVSYSMLEYNWVHPQDSNYHEPMPNISAPYANSWEYPQCVGSDIADETRGGVSFNAASPISTPDNSLDAWVTESPVSSLRVDQPHLTSSTCSSNCSCDCGPVWQKKPSRPSKSYSTSSSSNIDSSLVGKRARKNRTNFSQAQLNKLEDFFNRIKYPDYHQREAMGRDLGFDEEVIQIWFKNRRAKLTNFAKSSSSDTQEIPQRPEDLEQERGAKRSRRGRASFTPEQLSILEDVFQQNKYPDIHELDELSEKLNLPTRVLRIWFKNNRAKLTKKQ
jgi:hypothetical protein